MIFRRLEIHNIASIEHAEIDFDRGALAGCEVFLITGRTGAGKSTILDAICLALFATTPRMSNNRMQGDTDDNGLNITLKDARQLMRRNTGECHATLSFTGSNGTDYEATWSVARAYGKPGRKLQSKTWVLTNKSSGRTLTKDKEIETEIKEAIGLDFKQFCRTVMLAQGDFTRFLNSSDNEKAEILEKITGADIYSRISASIFSITAARRAELERTELKLGSVRTINQDERDSINEELNQLSIRINESAESISQLQTQIQWCRNLNELNLRKEKASLLVKETAGAIASENHIRQSALIRQWNESAQVRGFISNIEHARHSIALYRERLGKLHGHYCRIASQTLALQRHISMLDVRRDRLATAIRTEHESADVFANAQSVAEKLRYMERIRDERMKSEAESDRLQKMLDTHLRRNTAEARAAYDELSARLTESESKLSQARTELTGRDIESLRAQKEQLLKRRNDLNMAMERINAIASAKASRHKSELQAERNEKLLAELKAEADSIGKSLTEALDAKVKAEIALNRQKDTVDKFAVELRSRLRCGDTCPVCGQEITSALPSDSMLEELCRVAAEEYRRASDRHSAVQEQLMGVSANIKAISARLNQDRDMLKHDTSVTDATALALAACTKCGVDITGTDPAGSIVTLSKECDATTGIVCERIREAEIIEKNVSALTVEHESLHRQQSALNETLTKANSALTECENRLKASMELTGLRKSEYDTVMAEVTGICGGYLSRELINSSPSKAAHLLLTASRNYDSMLKEHDRLIIETERLTSIHSLASASVKSIAAAVPQWNADTAATAVPDFNSLVAEASSLYTDIQKLTTCIAAEQQTISLSETKIEQYLSEHRHTTRKELEQLSATDAGEIGRISESIRLIQEAHISNVSLLEATETQLSELLTAKPHGTVDTDTGNLSRMESELKQIHNGLLQRQAALAALLKNDEDIRRQQLGLVRLRDELREDCMKWERLNTIFGEKNGGKFRKIAQSYILSSLIDKANHYMRQLTDRYTLSVAPGTFVISLSDAYQGYATRSAATISGGESFLVSLSLALALSDMGTRLAVKTLFIDEGFGTLSGEPLQNAIETLRSLHHRTGRQVGIISHITELRECLPVQINVNRRGNFSAATITITDNNHT